MKKFNLMAAVGASALMLAGAMATSASAQPGRYYERGYDRGYDNYTQGHLSTSYVDSLEWRINNSPISYGEKRALLRELRSIQPIAWRVQTGQASRWEVNRLATGVRRIEQATRYADANDGRYRRYGYNERRW